MFGDPEIPILKDLSFDVKRGEIFSIFGVAGSGKSPLDTSIAENYPGVSVVHGCQPQWGASVLHLPQSFGSKQMTFDVWSNEVLRPLESKFSQLSVIKSEGALLFKQFYGPNFTWDLLMTDFSKFTSVQLKILSLCLLLQTPCDFIILDEPTTGLKLSEFNLVLYWIRSCLKTKGFLWLTWDRQLEVTLKLHGPVAILRVVECGVLETMTWVCKNCQRENAVAWQLC